MTPDQSRLELEEVPKEEWDRLMVDLERAWPICAIKVKGQVAWLVEQVERLEKLLGEPGEGNRYRLMLNDNNALHTENERLRLQVSTTNSNWPHEKKLHEEMDLLRAENENLSVKIQRTVNAAYHALLEMSAWLGIPEKKRNGQIKCLMENVKFCAEHDLRHLDRKEFPRE